MIVLEIIPEADGESQFMTAHNQIAGVGVSAQEIDRREVLAMIRVAADAVSHAACLDDEHTGQPNR